MVKANNPSNNNAILASSIMRDVEKKTSLVDGLIFSLLSGSGGIDRFCVLCYCLLLISNLY